MAGVPLKTVQELMGHKTIQMMDRYAHLSPGHLQNAGELLSGKNGPKQPLESIRKQ
jgi:site-specific recombinase XerD